MAEKVAKKVMRKHLYLRHLVPVTVWLAAVAAVTWMFYERAQRFEAVGIARGQVRQIAANCTGRIVEIRAPLYAPIQKGQTLVVVDTVTDNEQADEAKLRSQLAAAAAEAERFSAQLVPTQEKLRADAANMQMNQKDNWRRFEMDVDSAALTHPRSPGDPRGGARQPR